MAENTQFKPEQIEAMKAANAHGFVDFVTTHGVPGKDGKLRSVGVDEAVGLYQKAASFNDKFQAGVEKVKEVVRTNVKSAAAAA